MNLRNRKTVFCICIILLFLLFGLLYFLSTIIFIRISTGNLMEEAQNQTSRPIQLEFTARLSPLLKGTASQGNVLFSPIIIYQILVLFYLGSSTETRTELQKLIGDDDRILEFRNDMNDILKAIGENNDFEIQNDGQKTELMLFIAAFIADSIKVKENFVDQVLEYLHTPVQTTNFRDQNSAKENINRWLANQDVTGNHKLSASLDEETTLFLIGSIFFNATWYYPSSEQNTIEEKFNTSLELVDVLMIKTKMSLTHYQNTELKFEAILLPFSRADLSMLIILPDLEEDIQRVVSSITAQELEKIIESPTKKFVNLKFPRFKFHGSTSGHIQLSDALSLSTLDQNPDFSKISDNLSANPRITVIQQAKFEINEMGSPKLESTPDESNSTSTNFYVNRAFLLYVLETSKKYIFSSGIVYNPTEK